MKIYEYRERSDSQLIIIRIGFVALLEWALWRTFADGVGPAADILGRSAIMIVMALAFWWLAVGTRRWPGQRTFAYWLALFFVMLNGLAPVLSKLPDWQSVPKPMLLSTAVSTLAALVVWLVITRIEGSIWSALRRAQEQSAQPQDISRQKRNTAYSHAYYGSRLLWGEEIGDRYTAYLAEMDPQVWNEFVGTLAKNGHDEFALVQFRNGVRWHRDNPAAIDALHTVIESARQLGGEPEVENLLHWVSRTHPGSAVAEAAQAAAAQM